ncbi:esterase-like activity of phytase family protein [Pelagicoccus sp. SDUM812005]|uniref:esterase-like activity of phytase family protein n=1 Tax=Pelagicoccus sp. SDUM812005 TaxID=3041257 RepID=UPI00280D38EB|nr:esterase-like activity of phytase family protein [Pelagicoccus sp. SDUM812005]MDQ8182128.1 esterase-like activity of phytase family protein [Pelagicoccus sp. SDUM812005]
MIFKSNANSGSAFGLGAAFKFGAALLLAAIALLLFLSPKSPFPPTDPDQGNGNGGDTPGQGENPDQPSQPGKKKKDYFTRIASFPVFLNSDIDNETVSEIIAATKNGKTLVYTDAALEAIGFVDISDAHNPVPLGTVELEGEPTSVKVLGKYALVCINTSEDYVNTSGQLVVVNIAKQKIVASLELGGQPDAIAISPDERYTAIAIENERDEDLGDGAPPQAPAGFLAIVDLVGKPSNWNVRSVNLEGIPTLFPEDPEPEFVDINENNLAVVTLQENNHIVIVNLRNGRIVNDFSAGTVDLAQVDTNENDLIELNSSLTNLPREADAVAWIDNKRFVTADEGDLDGGSRGFTIYRKNGKVLFTSGSMDDHITAMVGHYPESRSENKGNEPEGVTVAKYGDDQLIFIGSERSSIVSVYKLPKNSNEPEFLQVLAGGMGPEGLLAIPNRNLFVTASEEDSRDDKFRATITLYKRNAKEPNYPTIASEDGPDGTPIPWAALSALAADPSDAGQAWTVYDSYYKKSRIFSVDTSDSPALIDAEIVLKDTNDVFKIAIENAILAATTPGNPYHDAIEAAGLDLFQLNVDDLINEDGTVNLDPEGLARRANGGFWLASEGAGSIGDESNPIESLNWLFKVAEDGTIEEVVSLPDSVNAKQVRFGYEGVAVTGSGDNEILYVAIQRKWAGDAEPRIGRYDTATGEWTFALYPLDAPESAAGGWVGLSEIVALDDTTFLALERDNQANVDAAIKKIYQFSTAGLAFKDDSMSDSLETISKSLVLDILPNLEAPNGMVIEKVEGLAVLANGDAIIVTDNDGVEDSSGETQFINLGPLPSN